MDTIYDSETDGVFEILIPRNIRSDLGSMEWRESDHDPYMEERSIFIGTVFELYPSGKYYMPWACGNLDPCPDCNGSGETLEPVTCDLCHGSGSRELSDREADSPYYSAMGASAGDCVICYRCKGKGKAIADCATCGGLGSDEAYQDQQFSEQLEREAELLGLSVESGEGDPCDLFLCEYRDKDSE